MHRVVTATCEDGVLKPAEELPLHERQQVLLIVVPLQKTVTSSTPDPARLATMQEQAGTWLAQQPANAVRPPLWLEQKAEQALDDGFVAALAELRAHASQFSAETLIADIDAVLADGRGLSAADRSRLEAELDAVLAELCGGLWR